MWGSFAVWIKKQVGWRRYATLFTLGLLAALSLPPIYAFPLLVVALSSLFWQLEMTQNVKQAFAVGWWWGLGFFIGGLYWISHALLVDLSYAWLIPFALIGLNGILAIYIGLVCLAAYFFRKYRRPRRLFCFVLLWLVAEWLRATLFTGFPWNLMGYSLAFSTPLLQLAAYASVYGLSFLAVLFATLPALLDHPSAYRKPVVWALLCIPIMLFVCGITRIAWLKLEYARDTGITLRVVQANIEQSTKWDPEGKREAWRTQLMLTHSPGLEKIDAVIWPETAIPFTLTEQDDEWRRVLSAGLPEGGYFMGGVVRREEADRQIPTLYNSIIVLSKKGGVEALYDKHHLVPFGEYVPFRSILPIDKITHGQLDFSKGPGAKTLTLPGLGNVGPLICYEAIFPGEVIDNKNPPNWLLNITNDGWFGASSGPYQHLTMARLRAIEEGIPLVRAANTGISALIDAVGSIRASLPLNQKGVMDISLPSPIAKKTIIGGIYKKLILFLIVISGFFFCYSLQPD